MSSRRKLEPTSSSRGFFAHVCAGPAARSRRSDSARAARKGSGARRGLYRFRRLCRARASRTGNRRWASPRAAPPISLKSRVARAPRRAGSSECRLWETGRSDNARASRATTPGRRRRGRRAPPAPPCKARAFRRLEDAKARDSSCRAAARKGHRPLWKARSDRRSFCRGRPPARRSRRCRRPRRRDFLGAAARRARKIP